MSNLEAIYKHAAAVAFKAGISAHDQEGLAAWIRSNCKYRPETEYFLVLGIGSELADLEALEKGFKSETHRAFTAATEALMKKREKVGTSHSGKYSYWLDRRDLYVYQFNEVDRNWQGWLCRYPSFDAFTHIERVAVAAGE